MTQYGTCPVCKKTADQRYRPFCSKRCSDVDLGRWLKGRYAVPSDEIAPIPEEGEE